jgi:hypothetical protein
LFLIYLILLCGLCCERRRLPADTRQFLIERRRVSGANPSYIGESCQVQRFWHLCTMSLRRLVAVTFYPASSQSPRLINPRAGPKVRALTDEGKFSELSQSCSMILLQPSHLRCTSIERVFSNCLQRIFLNLTNAPCS